MFIRIREAVLAAVLALLILAWLSQPSQADLVISRTIELHELYLTICDEIRAPEDAHFIMAIQRSFNDGRLLSIYVRQGDSWFEPAEHGTASLQGLNFSTYLIRAGSGTAIVHSYLLLSRGLNTTLAIPLYPIVSECISECNVTIKFVEGISNITTQPALELRQIDGVQALVTPTRKVPAMHLSWLNITYSLAEEVSKALCSKCARHVYIQLDGSLKISDYITLTSIDPNPVKIIKLKLSAEAKEVRVGDYFGTYSLVPQVEPQQLGSYSTSTLGRYLLLGVRPRFTIRHGENVTLILTYIIQSSEPGLVRLPTSSLYGIPIVLLEVYVYPPPGGSITHANLPINNGVASARLSWWPPPVPLMEVAYYAAPLTLPWLFLAALVASFTASTSYLLLRSKRRICTERLPPAPHLEPFVTKYEYKLALINKHVRLLYDLAVGKLKVKSYERSVRTLLTELARLEAELKEGGERLRSSWPALEEPLDELKRLEGELVKMRGRLDQALNKAKSGKMTREAFKREVQEVKARLEEVVRSARIVLGKLLAKT